jgi:hypothetical protein
MIGISEAPLAANSSLRLYRINRDRALAQRP